MTQSRKCAFQLSDLYSINTKKIRFCGYAFKVADLSNGLQHPQQAIDLYDTFIKRFPKHTKAVAAIFMQAFLYETVE